VVAYNFHCGCSNNIINGTYIIYCNLTYNNIIISFRVRRFSRRPMDKVMLVQAIRLIVGRRERPAQSTVLPLVLSLHNTDTNAPSNLRQVVIIVITNVLGNVMTTS